MNNDIRNLIQKRTTEQLKIIKDTILFLSVRVGKTKIVLDSIEKDDKVLIVYPNTSIKQSWLTDITKFPPLSTNITFVTKASIHKYINTEWDYLILDEISMMQSDKQIKAIKTIKYNKRVAMTGVMNSKTEKKLKEQLGLIIGITYTMEHAIKDKLVKDYRIYLHMINLSNSTFIEVDWFKSKIKLSERNLYKYYTEQMDKAKLYVDDEVDVIKWTGIYNKFMGLRTNMLYNSPSLLDRTKELIKRFENKKTLIYTMRTDIADELSDTSYHSKNKEEEVLESFKIANSGHLAVVNSINAGITIEKLNHVIFHSYVSNAETVTQQLARSLLWEFEGEYSKIHFIVLKDTQMENWVDKACTSLDQRKISYVIDNKTYSKLDYIKSQHPDKKLYLYKGSIVYYSHEEQNGIWTNKMYKFLENPNQAYSLNPRNLQEI